MIPSPRFATPEDIRIIEERLKGFDTPGAWLQRQFDSRFDAHIKGLEDFLEDQGRREAGQHQVRPDKG